MKYKLLKPVFLTLLLSLSAALSGCNSKKEIKLTNLQSEEGSGNASSGITTPVGGNVIISINFKGNDSFGSKTLRKKLDFKVGDKYDSVLIDSGRNALIEFYRKKGFPETKVTLDTSQLLQGKITYIIDEGPQFKIKSVRFRGNKVIKTSDLKSIIKTKTREWLFWPGYYTKEKIDADVKRLQEAYYQRGFLNYDIEALGRSNITFLIDEGKQYRIGKIDVTGNKYFDAEKLLKGFELKTGDIYYPLKAQTQAKRMLKLYRENGFVDAQVTQQHVFTEGDKNIVDLVFKITEGKQFRIGKIEITGNEQTQDKVVRRVLEEYGFSPGDLYNAAMAPPEGGGELDRRVQRATLAEEVSITPVTPKENPDDRLDAVVNLEQGLTGQWNAGAAYGSDGGLVGQFSYVERNFDIFDWPKNFNDFITRNSFRGAGQELK